MLAQQAKFIYLSLALAWLVSLMPWSGWALTLRPDFVLLTLIFWCLRAPHLCNVGTAWFVGLCVDLAAGTVFGYYALTYTMVAFVVITYQTRWVLFHGLQQLASVFLLLFMAQWSLLLLHSFGATPAWDWTYFLPTFTGVGLWQLAVVLGLNTGGRAHGR